MSNMAKSLSSREAAIITGVSAGLGKPFADRFAKRGEYLIIVARRAERFDAPGLRCRCSILPP